MAPIDFTQPFPDYVTCPRCGEPEVEAWCFELTATCHACGHVFKHAMPAECEEVCTEEVRLQAARLIRGPLRAQTCRQINVH
jgi:rubredoxin